jgi:hypothetical protein
MLSVLSHMWSFHMKHPHYKSAMHMGVFGIAAVLCVLILILILSSKNFIFFLILNYFFMFWIF